jgi:hypothetical protein
MHFFGSRSKAKRPEVQVPVPTRALLCLIEGDHAVFEIEADTNERTHHLKKSIYQEGKDRTLSHVGAKDLILLKVTES